MYFFSEIFVIICSAESILVFKCASDGEHVSIIRLWVHVVNSDDVSYSFKSNSRPDMFVFFYVRNLMLYSTSIFKMFEYHFERSNAI